MSECFHDQFLARTFLSFSPVYSYWDKYLANNVLDKLLKLKNLRVLSLHGYKICDLPDSIGDMKHLRYLDLSCNDISYLPESTCSLYNLQMLSLEDCKQLKKFPSKMENLINLCHLDIRGCVELKEMPIGVKALKSLRQLSNFLVITDGGLFEWPEMKNFDHVRGSLTLFNLEDVVDAKDAGDANLKERKLDFLALGWGPFGDIRNADTEKIVLDMLQPHQNLKELRIKYYAGKEFSKWLRDPSFSYMTHLKLYNCERCTCLPSLGQLPSLKVLVIIGMTAVQSVGPEFYGSTGQSKIFPSLEYLKFENMPKWENWTRYEDSDKQVEVFSSLSEFYLLECPKLSGKLPNHLLMLKNLEIRGCEKLNFNVSEELISRNLPCGVEDLSSIDCARIEKLEIDNCLNLENLEWLHEDLNSLSHLQNVCIKHCPGFISFPQGGLASNNLTHLIIWKCENLMALPNGMCNLTLLEIRDCPRMNFVPEEGFLANLKTLYIYKGAENILRQLMEWGFDKLTCLKYLEISGGEDCVMEEMIEINLPTSLITLIIGGYPRMKFVPEEGFLANLKTLYIYKGAKNILRQLMEWGFHRLTCLEHLEIEGGEDCVMEEMIEINLPTSLITLEIRDFPKIVALSLSLPISLTELEIESCPDLEYMSCSNGFHNLTSLTMLTIDYCPKLKSLPKEGLPPSLVELWISGCPLVSERCKRDKGEDWPKIANIPLVSCI